MKLKPKLDTDKWQLFLALLLLFLGLLFGILASLHYSGNGIEKDKIGFVSLRPLHVSYVILWIILSAQAMVNHVMQMQSGKRIPSWISYGKLLLLSVAILAMTMAYFNSRFGGREYWEFPPWIGVLFFAVWILQLLGMISLIGKLNFQKVYVWMWFTGAFFLMLTFLESYAWLLPGIRKSTIQDITLQWKSSGSMVGAWNQMIYGLAIWLMCALEGNSEMARGKTAFVLYFLGLTNLMFNWGHHIYTLPTQPYVRYISYAVSMSEWILLVRIIQNWKKDKKNIKKFKHNPAYYFILAADFWIVINLFLALCMSIPAINLYTHGTHITVAHSMGTTIGINTMILLSCICWFYFQKFGKSPLTHFHRNWWILQITLVLFWCILIYAGVMRSIWQMQEGHSPLSVLMKNMKPVFLVFSIAGTIFTIQLLRFIYGFLRPGRDWLRESK
ncbi:MAG: cbb3-type cytochrome c oxidase subunit I [Bacteroidetes bacterium]|nr:cbb3-type cytochrome c oxidase subunit I [Bacteroidota bacterium]